MLSIDFRDKVALVCGSGAGGIGTATAKLLSEAGAYVVAVDYKDELVEETKAMIAGLGGECLGITVDLRKPSEVSRIAETIRAKIGRIDLVANIAGGTQQGQWLRLDRTPDDVYASVMALNVDYVFRVCRDMAALMIESGKGGAIVNIASVSAFASAPYHGPYGAAKRAVAALTQTMAVEWGRFKIRANTVMPGSVNTARAKNTGADLQGRQKYWAPLQRPVESDEIASAVMFFLSDLSSAITGQTLAVDCGVTSKCAIGDLDYVGGKMLESDR